MDTISKQELINELRKKRFHASQVDPRAVCVSIEHAEKIVKRAFDAGMNSFEKSINILSESKNECQNVDYNYAIGKVRNITLDQAFNKRTYQVELSDESMNANGLHECDKVHMYKLATRTFCKRTAPKVGSIVKLKSRKTKAKPHFDIDDSLIVEVINDNDKNN